MLTTSHFVVSESRSLISTIEVFGVCSTVVSSPSLTWAARRLKEFFNSVWQFINKDLSALLHFCTRPARPLRYIHRPYISLGRFFVIEEKLYKFPPSLQVFGFRYQDFPNTHTSSSRNHRLLCPLQDFPNAYRHNPYISRVLIFQFIFPNGRTPPWVCGALLQGNNVVRFVPSFLVWSILLMVVCCFPSESVC